MKHMHTETMHRIAKEALYDYLVAPFGYSLVVWRDGSWAILEGNTSDPQMIAKVPCPGMANLGDDWFEGWASQGDDGVYCIEAGYDAERAGQPVSLADAIRECIDHGDVTEHIDELAEHLRLAGGAAMVEGAP